MLLDFWYPGGLGRYARFKILHPQASNQSSVSPRNMKVVEIIDDDNDD